MSISSDGSEVIGRVHPETAYAARMADADHYRLWRSEHPLYAPWSDDSLICSDIEDVEALTLNDRPRLYYLAALARHAAALGGAFAECGVFRGGTALMLSRVSSVHCNELHLLDSFEGLSQPDCGHDVFYRPGDFASTDTEMVVTLLDEAGPRVRVYQGWIPQVLAQLPQRRWALVHVDVDLYQPTWDTCEHFYDDMMPGGVFVFDEYGFPTCRGERDAVDEFFASRPETPIALPTGQSFVIKL
ncbi:TylF/MycF/NovP-related O-methyltransferase [Nonomuraea sp. NPDC050556]|uniref:TylF/MycF/NovP-related O-methyltransferase n=1 Tax=Nonomuraea sp. NPDC050556 TaxID=3364369 RepID=UPI0037B628AD